MKRSARASGSCISRRRAVVDESSEYVFVCCGSGIQVVSVATGEKVHSLLGHEAEITGLATVPGTQQVYSSSMDGTGNILLVSSCVRRSLILLF
jgi:WD40 repeat protein